MEKTPQDEPVNDRPTSCSVSLPDWAIEKMKTLPGEMADGEMQMRTVIEWSRRNVEHGTGGPFAAGVFARRSGRVLAIGLNRVIPERNATAHAEIVAISLAQNYLDVWDLSDIDSEGCRLVVNAQPCTMCFGAVIWSGVRELSFAVDKATVEQITGFDEGPLPENWRQALTRRGIQLSPSALVDEAAQVLRMYVESNQEIYNARRPRP